MSKTHSNISAKSLLKSSLLFTVGLSTLALATSASAQDAGDEVIATGIRQSLENALIEKREADSLVEVILAEDIRRQINHELGFGHFTSFVNQFRIEHAKTLLRDPQRSHEKIIAIAFDSGFASLPSFQRVFKSSVGTSPSEWKKSG